MPEGSHLAVHAIRDHRPAETSLADAPEIRAELAARPPARAGRARGASPGARDTLSRPPVLPGAAAHRPIDDGAHRDRDVAGGGDADQNLEQRPRSEEHTSELQSQSNLVCRLLLEKKK